MAKPNDMSEQPVAGAAAEPAPAAAPADGAEAVPIYRQPGFVWEPEYINVMVSAHAGNLELSNMADSKASILLGASFVVFGLSISDIATGKASIPMIVLTMFSFVATVLGVLTVRPARMRDWKVEPGKANMMFFGSFTNVTKEQYIEQCLNALASPEESIRAMAADVYDHGKLLKADKFSWLYWSYTAFLWGMYITAGVVLIDVYFR